MKKEVREAIAEFQAPLGAVRERLAKTSRRYADKYNRAVNAFRWARWSPEVKRNLRRTTKNAEQRRRVALAMERAFVDNAYLLARLAK